MDSQTEIQQQNQENREKLLKQREELVKNLKEANYKGSEEIQRKCNQYIELSKQQQEIKKKNYTPDDNTRLYDYFESYFNIQMQEQKDDKQFQNLSQKQQEFHDTTQGKFFNKEFDLNEYTSNFNPQVYNPKTVVQHESENYDKLAMRALRGTDIAPVNQTQQQILQSQIMMEIKNKNASYQQQKQQ
ncbi:hypothetical protein PPERSA_11733 [Pseudocohnilembus persalinus]|uniref:Uncharacterized protein n=1 Tax=Pseudocohnilembus persalinus TaxID=266149 RepID=A0A0V0QGF3_PSEPJ|nr:hypothetical protein PPERSA_11733 [Pseudocohnilembus persalinus]|eukprot:KRX01286.1 hypothetical protein PPERSA_11733 [Pseudocohnilembus persalinus]